MKLGIDVFFYSRENASKMDIKRWKQIILQKWGKLPEACSRKYLFCISTCSLYEEEQAILQIDTRNMNNFSVD